MLYSSYYVINITDICYMFFLYVFYSYFRQKILYVPTCVLSNKLFLSSCTFVFVISCICIEVYY